MNARSLAEGAVDTQEILRLATDLASMLRAKVTRDARRGVAGWHNNFTPGRIGTTGSALPLEFLRLVGSVDKDLELAVVRGLLGAQMPSGGWSILSIEQWATVEGTVPPLAALRRSSGPGVSEAIVKGRAWLESQQGIDGGWGSTSIDESRVCLTARVLSLMAQFDAPDQSKIHRACEWLRSIQHGDGSWGPIIGARGSVVHTALAMRALIAAGVAIHDRSIENGLDFLEKNWSPRLNATLTETYDVRIASGAYSKVSMVHDVDAEIVLTLLETDYVGHRAPLWLAVAQWVTANHDHKWWEGMEPLASLWTTIPRATAAVKISRHFGSTRSTIRWSSGGFAVTTGSSRRPVLRLAILAVRTLPQWFRLLGLTVFVIISAACVSLYALGLIDITGLILGLIVPSALAISQMLVTRPSR